MSEFNDEETLSGTEMALNEIREDLPYGEPGSWYWKDMAPLREKIHYYAQRERIQKMNEEEEKRKKK